MKHQGPQPFRGADECVPDAQGLLSFRALLTIAHAFSRFLLHSPRQRLALRRSCTL
jgi:hypothetical protein